MINDYLKNAAKEMASVEDEVRVIYRQQATYFQMFFEELTLAGFNEKQAMQIVVAAAGKNE
ncbi:hypothetical protein [Bacillus sp. XF8]|uniref:hypothetical protein n=1 Tax=Bacillus sp. XF8 TaxID=2819289 RepID=UPI001AA0846C|nr:hypothetical protein [Bacillus sp. XF8]MBO1583144.1 hypothetical protein [Bacillus sp. XF8]